MVGIIGAMNEEMELVLKEMESVVAHECAGMKFFQGRLGNTDVALGLSGIGKINAAMATQIMIDRFGARKVMLCGLAGSLTPALQRGDVVVSSHVVQYDFDLTSFGRRPGEIPNSERLVEADPTLLKLACHAFDSEYLDQPNRPQLLVGVIASGDSFVSDKRKLKWLQREFGAVATEMEGAAVGYVCHRNKIPFVVVRIISDNASSGAATDFREALESAAKKTLTLITGMLELLAHDPRALTE